MDGAIDRQHAHQLLDQLEAGQLAAVVHLLEVMTDPVARSLAAAPVEEEPTSDDEARTAWCSCPRAPRPWRFSGCVLTGSGAKWPEAVARLSGEPR